MNTQPATRPTRSARRARRRYEKGMTLLEIMIVIAIIGLVASVVSVGVMGQLESGKVKTTQIAVNNVLKRLDLYKVDHGDYPGQSEGMRGLTNPPNGFQPYLKEKDTKDSWGQPMLYFNPARSGGKGVEVRSKGPDKQEGTDDDISATSL